MSFTRGLKQGGFPKPGEELRDVPGRHSRDGWAHIADYDSTYIEGKQYKHMREWTKPCAVCGGAIHAFEKIGTVDANSRFSNRTCKDHRGLLPAIERGFIAWSAEAGAIVAGPSCGIGGGEIDDIKRERSELRQAVMDLGVTCSQLRQSAEQSRAEYDKAMAENVTLRQRLAQFDLPAAMASLNASSVCETVQNTSDSVPAFPWSQS